MKYESLFKVLAVMILLASASYGVEVLLDDPHTGSIMGTWGGGLGTFFTMDNTRTAYKLGFIDVNDAGLDTGPDGLVVEHEVLLYNYDTSTLLASATVPAGTAGELIGDFRYADLDTPVTLQASTEYLIVATPYDHNSATGDRYRNVVNYTPNSYFVDDTDPNNWARGHFNPWDQLPNLSYVIGQAYGGPNLVTPEPMTIALLGAGAVLMRRRKRI